MGISRWSKICWAAIGLLSCISLGKISTALAQPQPQERPFKVEWRHELLSVQAEGIPLSQVLLKVSRQTGLVIRGLEGLNAPVSLSFSGLPLPQGLKKILARINYAILEESNGQGKIRPTRLLILEQGAGPSIEKILSGAGEVPGPGPSPEEIQATDEGIAPEPPAEENGPESE